MSRVQDIPGFVDLTPRQQSRQYSELVGQGIVANLLQLARQGKLEIELLRKIVHDPERLSSLIDKVRAFANGESITRSIDTSTYC